MKILLRIIFFQLMFLNICSINAQMVSSKIIDSITKEPVPYATILYKKSGMISNEEGRFSFLYRKDSRPSDTLMISCIGFKSVAKPLNQFKDSVIYLVPQTIELKEVVLSSKKYSAEEIIEKVKENIAKNYNFDLTRKRLFFRESNHQNFLKSNYTLKKSTIKELNKPFLDSVMASIPKSNSYYTEVLCDLYGNLSKEKQKIGLIKASELYDKNNEIGMKALEEKFETIVNKNVKKDSYFKIKSGIFGQKVDLNEFKTEEVDSTNTEALQKKLEEEKNRKEARKKNFAKYRRSSLGSLFNGLFFHEKAKLNFINKSNRYEFSVADITYMGDDAVYVLEFKPKRSEDYKGKIYVHTEDFAIIRVDYENVNVLKNFKLLGISYRWHLAKGKMIFGKGEDERYNLQYLEKEDASRFGIRRPLKIIEKNKNVKGRRKQNELYVKLDMAISSSNKHEVVVFDTGAIDASAFDGFKEKNTVLPTYMPKYNPEFWKGYDIIEPNQAIKDFTVIAEE
ncbi:MAG: carboxypeptidase-like regulatory domain-containing protein [Flavobacteriaceae bacterium]|nr:carboxypeptidase-like regulatory domain-containing protein [Flavobacteriaceae bacterium]